MLARLHSIRICLLLLALMAGSKVLAHITSYDLGHPLVNAADAGNEVAVRSILARGEFVDIRGDFGVTPLMRASIRGHTKLVELLLQQGADVDAIDLGGASALHLATRNGHYEAVRRLLEVGAEVNAADDDGWTPLMRAIANRDTALVALMVEHQPDLLQKNLYGENGVHMAVKAAKPELLELVLAKVSPSSINQEELYKLAGNNTHVKEELHRFCGNTIPHNNAIVLEKPQQEDIEGLPWLASKTSDMAGRNNVTEEAPLLLEFVDQILASAVETLEALPNTSPEPRNPPKAGNSNVQIGRAFRLSSEEMEHILHNKHLQPRVLSQITNENKALLEGYNEYVSILISEKQTNEGRLAQN